ncbi:MAG: adenine phosphoribosyltransferase [Spirochaetaceae bacterium]|nr:MAG: adenine phosphoribosyltransferase [Spirochaetaceae bacterium]
MPVGGDFDLDGAIRKVPDFPKQGILFYDITSILTSPQAFGYCIDQAQAFCLEARANALAAVEARGFLFAAPLAARLQLPLLLVRKKGKLPGETYRASFTLEYGQDEIEVHKADVKKGQRILLVDDLIATGGTIKAAADLFTAAGVTVTGIFAVVGLSFLSYEKVLEGYEVRTLIQYHGE